MRRHRAGGFAARDRNHSVGHILSKLQSGANSGFHLSTLLSSMSDSGSGHHSWSRNRSRSFGDRSVSANPRMVEVRAKVLKQNDFLAHSLREQFRANGVYVISLVSSPGSGKTAFLEKLLSRVGADH